MRQVFSLNDSQWFVGAVAPLPYPAPNDSAQVRGWLPATVPGDVRLDLLRFNKIPDPFLGRNNEASQWVDDYDWWFRRDLTFNLQEDARVFLLFAGIDYQCAVYWDDTLLGTHVGMFSRQEYEIPPALRRDKMHCLTVRVSGGNQLPRLKRSAAERAWQEISCRLLPHPPQSHDFPDRYATLKCQMSYGWDFAPRLLTCGIWDDASLVQVRDVLIRDAQVQGLPDGRVRVTLDMDTTRVLDARVQFTVTPKNFDAPAQEFEMPLRLETCGPYRFSFELNAPRVWNPWDRGAPNLYALATRILDDAGEMDRYETSFGLRTVELAPNSGASPDTAPWTFLVNGQVEFIRGANWVPADAIPARVTHKDYTELLQLARDANINLLRVWGGGLKEKRAFYDICDELGLLVWQEFPLTGAGIDYFPRDAAYLKLLAQEAGAIVQTLRNHPSVALWCGGNEFIPRANRHVTHLLRELVARNDGTRPFKFSSPSQDESHNWRVWHGGANTRDYEKDDALLFGEFGLQSAPNVETLGRFLPDDAQFPPNDEWAYHNADVEKLWRYGHPYLTFRAERGISGAADRSEDSLREFVDASQEAQLRGLQTAIEYARRSKPRVSGCVFWQFNEPWYSICWSVLDYTHAPKRAYHKIKELYNPFLAMFAYPRLARQPGEPVEGELWLVNDTLEPVQGILSVWHNDARVWARDAVAQANRAQAVAFLGVTLEKGPNALRLEFRGEHIVSTNEYDLNYCDMGEISARRARMQDLAARLRTST